MSHSCVIVADDYHQSTWPIIWEAVTNKRYWVGLLHYGTSVDARRHSLHGTCPGRLLIPDVGVGQAPDIALRGLANRRRLVLVAALANAGQGDVAVAPA
jgi:hypothetical protein